MINFDLSTEERAVIFKATSKALEEVYAHPTAFSVAPLLKPKDVKKFIHEMKFEASVDKEQAVLKVVEGLKRFAVHTHHPRYFGLFNSRPNAISVLADHITAIMNPQMAAWSHAPFANEAERYVIAEFGKKIGYPAERIDGTFTGGGAESNLTAVQCALTHHFPVVSEKGVMAIHQRPIIYCSTESHHSIVKAARTVGLGSNSVISIPVNQDLTMDIGLLKNRIEKDLSKGRRPFMIVATAGTTGSGAIDNIKKLSKLAKKRELWLHIDGAYGAAVLASRTYKSLLAGIKKSDSVTVDFHKWFSVPMGASAFITQRDEVLFQTYNIKTAYMPPDGDQKECVDPYLHSIQWSRRFTGLKIFLPLVVFGWEGYEGMIDNDIAMGSRLRKMLKKSGWSIKNDAKIPVICFSHPTIEGQDTLIRKLVDGVVNSGTAWISVYPIHGKSTIRACISNYSTSIEDLEILLQTLNDQLELVTR